MIEWIRVFFLSFHFHSIIPSIFTFILSRDWLWLDKYLSSLDCIYSTVNLFRIDRSIYLFIYLFICIQHFDGNAPAYSHFELCISARKQMLNIFTMLRFDFNRNIYAVLIVFARAPPHIASAFSILNQILRQFGFSISPSYVVAGVLYDGSAGRNNIVIGFRLTFIFTAKWQIICAIKWMIECNGEKKIEHGQIKTKIQAFPAFCTTKFSHRVKNAINTTKRSHIFSMNSIE